MKFTKDAHSAVKNIFTLNFSAYQGTTKYLLPDEWHKPSCVLPYVGNLPGFPYSFQTYVLYVENFIKPFEWFMRKFNFRMFICHKNNLNLNI